MSEDIKSVGDFHLATAKILTSNGTVLDLKKSSNIVAINLHEDVQRNSILGEILLEDAAGFVNEGPIIGQEYLQLKLQTPSLKGEMEIIDFTKNVFVINSIQIGQKLVIKYLYTY